MSFIAHFFPVGPSGFGHRTTAEAVVVDLDLSGKTFLITGVNSGLGLETARVLSQKGARIIGLARTEEKIHGAFQEIPIENYHGIACDLSEPHQIQRAVEEIQALNIPIDALIANAGIMGLPTLQRKYGLELQFLTNHIGHFILVNGLRSSLSPQGRVIMVSSRAHQRTYREGIQLDNLDGAQGYSAWQAYGQSKLCNLLFARSLALKMPQEQKVFSVHPGVIPTNIFRHLPSSLQTLSNLFKDVFFKTIAEGAATQVYAAAHPNVLAKSGDYLVDCNTAKMSAHGNDMGLAAKLWIESETIVQRLLHTEAQ